MGLSLSPPLSCSGRQRVVTEPLICADGAGGTTDGPGAAGFGALQQARCRNKSVPLNQEVCVFIPWHLPHSLSLQNKGLSPVTLCTQRLPSLPCSCLSPPSRSPSSIQQQLAGSHVGTRLPHSPLILRPALLRQRQHGKMWQMQQLWQQMGNTGAQIQRRYIKIQLNITAISDDNRGTDSTHRGRAQADLDHRGCV